MQTLKELLTLQWKGDPKMVDHCLKNCLYIQSGDTFINVGSRKPGIQSDLWYDDETPRPDVTFEYFKDYNMSSNAPRLLGQRPLWVTINYHVDRTDGKLLAITVDDRGARSLTIEERLEADKALAGASQDYEKRLANYWKRYSDKVWARGYWANR